MHCNSSMNYNKIGLGRFTVSSHLKNCGLRTTRFIYFVHFKATPSLNVSLGIWKFAFVNQFSITPNNSVISAAKLLSTYLFMPVKKNSKHEGTIPRLCFQQSKLVKIIHHQVCRSN